MNIDWTKEDALVLQTVRLATKDNSGATISRLLRVGDYINRNIFDLNTLNSSLTKFCKCGLLYCDKEKFFLNEKFKIVFDEECTSKQLYKNLDQLFNILKTLNLKAKYKIDLQFLTKEFYDIAYKEYLDSFE